MALLQPLSDWLVHTPWQVFTSTFNQPWNMEPAYRQGHTTYGEVMSYLLSTSDFLWVTSRIKPVLTISKPTWFLSFYSWKEEGLFWKLEQLPSCFTKDLPSWIEAEPLWGHHLLKFGGPFQITNVLWIEESCTSGVEVSAWDMQDLRECLEFNIDTSASILVVIVSTINWAGSVVKATVEQKL